MSHRRVRLSGACLVLAALCVFPAGSALGESVMVKRAYVPGQIVYIERETASVQEITTTIMPPMKLHAEQLYGLWEKVESVTDGKATVVLTFDRASRNVEAPMMGSTEFDTDDPEHEEAAPQLGAVLKPMIGMAMTMEVDRNGQVISFTGMDAINEKVSEKAIASMHWEQMKDEFSDERGMESWGKEPLMFYPNKEVQVGDTWEGSTSVDQPPLGTFVTDYKFKVDRIGIENGRKSVIISVTGVVSAREEEDSEPAETQPAGPQTEVSGTLSGTGIYDVELGQVIKHSTKGNVDIKVPLSKLMPNLPASEEPQFANFKIDLHEQTRVLSEQERNAQKEEARQKAEARRKAEEEEDEEDEEEEDEDE